MKLDASGTLDGFGLHGRAAARTRVRGAPRPRSANGRADGPFEGFNPAEIAARKELDGHVSGTVNANFAHCATSTRRSPLDAITADGKIGLTQSTIGGLADRQRRRRRPLRRTGRRHHDVQCCRARREAERLGPDRARSHHYLQCEIPRRRHQPDGTRASRGAGGRRRERGPRRHAHRQRRIAHRRTGR